MKCEKIGKVPVQCTQAGRVDSLPPPLLRWRSCGGGGRLASHVLPGDFEQGRGGSLASKFGGLFSRVDLADFHGKTFWRVILADLFGGSFWHIYLAGFHK